MEDEIVYGLVIFDITDGVAFYVNAPVKESEIDMNDKHDRTVIDAAVEVLKKDTRLDLRTMVKDVYAIAEIDSY
jgi:hypothetical protein